jgi:L-asparaginase / beta-aspartyl-peptidase
MARKRGGRHCKRPNEVERDGRRWALAVHGGARKIAPADEQSNRDGCNRALFAGKAILAVGGSAVDAVEAAVRVLEDDPAFNAGFGSALNEAGEVEMCAGVMDGRDLSVGAVAIIQGVRNPVSVARKLLCEQAILLGAAGARRFAEESGCETCEPADLIVERSVASSGCDTVGAVALDMAGDLAAAASTGGLPGTRVGRIGDSPLPGCGYYADNELGAVALSGDGEAIARLGIAGRVVQALPHREPAGALAASLGRLERLGADGGGIAITRDGEIGWWHNSPRFAVAAASSKRPEGAAWLDKDEK